MHKPIHCTSHQIGLVITISAVFLVFCSQATEAPEPGVVAVIDGSRISADDLRERFWSGSQDERQASLRPGGRHFLLDALIADRLVAQEALRRKLAPQYSFIEPFHMKLMKRFLDAEFEPNQSPESIPDAEVSAEYKRLSPELEVPERRLLRIMVQTSRERAVEVISMFASKVAASDSVGVYRLLNDQSLREKGGGKGRFSREEAVGYLDEDLTEIVFALDASEVVHHEPVKFRGRWAVIAVEEVNEFRPAPPFDEVEEQLRQRLFTEKRERALNAFVASFRKNHQVIVNEDALELIPSGAERSLDQLAGSQK